MMSDPTQPVKTIREEVAEPKVVVPVVLKVMLPEPLTIREPEVWA